MSTTTSLIGLPTKILCKIIDQLPLSSHFDFACTCKQLAFEFQYLLHRHQEAHAKFLVASDLDPATVPSLLESAFGADPISAWHVRSFEVWRDRTSWDEWETYSLYTPVDFGLDGLVSGRVNLRFQHLLQRVGSYLYWYERYSYGNIKREKAFAQLERGHDGLLKALLFAKLPRLRDLKVVPRSQAPGSTLSWLKTLIRASKGVHPEPQPTHDTEEQDPCLRDETSEEGENITSSREDSERLLLQSQLDACQSPTESEFDSEWETAYAKYLEEQILQELKNVEHFEPKTEAASTQDVEMEFCTQNDKSKSCQDDEADLDHSLLADAAINTLLWPAGFTSLRLVAIGVESGTWMDDEEYPQSKALVVRLLRLPGLDTLYVNGLRCEPDDGSGDYENDDDSDAGSDWEDNESLYYDFPSRSASVRHLFFEGLGYELEGEFIEWLCDAPRKLRTVAFKNSGPNAGDFHGASRIVQKLKSTQGASLESFMWYGFDSRSAYSDECSVVNLHEDELDGFRTLKKLAFNVHDLAKGVDQIT